MRVRNGFAALAAAVSLIGALPAMMQAGQTVVEQRREVGVVKQATPRSMARSWWASKPNGHRSFTTKGRRHRSQLSRSKRRKARTA